MSKGLVIAAPHSGAGKTIVTLGLLRALRNRALSVAPAKVGPDYIDPRFHDIACGEVSINLDLWAMGKAALQNLATGHAANNELLLIEGVMGLFDGPIKGPGSTADVAAALGLPIILVVDARSQGQSVAALVSGFMNFRETCKIAGVILNQVGSDRHERLLREALDPLQMPVLGAIRRFPDISLPSRHLGLVQAVEMPDLDNQLENFARHIEETVDLDALLHHACEHSGTAEKTRPLPPLGQRIAVARDQAFGFAYPHLLQGWRKMGAEILPFSPLANEPAPSEADAIFLPGGYPELHAGKIAAAEDCLQSLKDAAARNTLIYGECGGYMLLGEHLTDAEGASHKMAGLLPVSTSYEKRKLHLGYRKLRHESPLPWPQTLNGHEFHYSATLEIAKAPALFSASDAADAALPSAGLQIGNIIGSYCHVIAKEPY